VWVCARVCACHSHSLPRSHARALSLSCSPSHSPAFSLYFIPAGVITLKTSSPLAFEDIVDVSFFAHTHQNSEPQALIAWRSIIGSLIFTGHFPQKSPKISGSFAERDLHLRAFYAFLPSCNPTPHRRLLLMKS